MPVSVIPPKESKEPRKSTVTVFKSSPIWKNRVLVLGSLSLLTYVS